MKPVRWGVLGTADIALRQSIPSIQKSETGVVAAIASRSHQRAGEVAERFSIPKAYDSYDQLIEDDQIDAVYIPLPNNLHLPWIEKAARKGKHVLCEKPLGLNEQEVMAVCQIANETGVKIIEAFNARYHPIHARVRDLIQEGAIGQMRFIRLSLGWSFAGKPDDYRWRPELGGGALLDLGGYVTQTSRYLSGSDPISVVATAQYHPQTGVDTDIGMMLSFPRGITAFADCGLLSAARNTYEVIGTEGKIHVETPFGNRATKRRLTLYDVTGQEVHSETSQAHQMTLQFEAVSRSIAERAPSPFPLEESLSLARILDACRLSAQENGRIVSLKPSDSDSISDLA